MALRRWRRRPACSTDDPLGQLHGLPAELGAQLADHLVALGGQLLLPALPDPLDLAVGLLLQLLGDAGGVGPGVVADLGDLLARLGLGVLEAPLRLAQPLGGLLAGVDLLLDVLLPVPDHLLDQRLHVAPEHEHDDHERGQLDR